jgi:ATP-dependent Clp protease ATP-binding subunit ClpA
LRLEESLQSAEAAEAWMERLFTNDDARLSREIAIGIHARRVLEGAITEADSLGHKEIGAGHLLLGLLRAEDTTAWRTLNGCGVTIRAAREALQQGT